MAENNEDENPPPPDGDDPSTPQEEPDHGFGFLAEFMRSEGQDHGYGFLAEFMRSQEDLDELHFKVKDESASSDDDELERQQKKVNEEYANVLVRLENLSAKVSSTFSTDRRQAGKPKKAIRDRLPRLNSLSDDSPDLSRINALSALGFVASLEAKCLKFLRQLVSLEPELQKSLDTAPAKARLIETEAAEALNSNQPKFSAALKFSLDLYRMTIQRTEEIKLTIGEYKPKIQAALADAHNSRTMLIAELAKLD